MNDPMFNLSTDVQSSVSALTKHGIDENGLRPSDAGHGLQVAVVPAVFLHVVVGHKRFAGLSQSDNSDHLHFTFHLHISQTMHRMKIQVAKMNSLIFVLPHLNDIDQHQSKCVNEIKYILDWNTFHSFIYFLMQIPTCPFNRVSGLIFCRGTNPLFTRIVMLNKAETVGIDQSVKNQSGTVRSTTLVLPSHPRSVQWNGVTTLAPVSPLDDRLPASLASLSGSTIERGRM